MQSNKKSSLETIGYIKEIPKDANINDYEKINVINKEGKSNILYRPKSKKPKIDETTNFNESWKVFNNHLN